MVTPAEKARSLRLGRLASMIEARLEHPAAALEALLSELKIGEAQTELWEGLHAASARDGKEAELAEAYAKATSSHRLGQLNPNAQAALLMHAADFTQGVLGDGAAAEALLERVIEICPGHPEAFARLSRRFDAAKDHKRLAELYAAVASAPPRSADELVHAAVNVVGALPAKSPISERACKRLLALVPASLSIVDVLEAHCKKTERPALACELIEQTLTEHELPKKSVIDLRRRVITLYIESTGYPERAMPHVEALFAEDVNDSHARAYAERLLSNRLVASRAAQLLQQARRSTRSEGGDAA